ncbi:MAG TPA: class I adenylate-forming enzyme family protein, partial [Acidimicrobiales bacterium]|nr:class I adenylate-forming enzyme family protein [Acidimicrobiales bacterium]
MTRASDSHLLTDQLRLMADEFGAETGYVDVTGDRSITFTEWDRESDRLARGLIDAGVVQGDRVAVYLPPDEPLEWVVAYAAVHKAGGIAVPTNVRLAPRELEYVLGHAGVVAAFAGRSTTAQLAEAAAALPDLRWVVTTADDRPATWAGWDDGGPKGAGSVQVPVGED